MRHQTQQDAQRSFHDEGEPPPEFVARVRQRRHRDARASRRSSATLGARCGERARVEQLKRHRRRVGVGVGVGSTMFPWRRRVDGSRRQLGRILLLLLLGVAAHIANVGAIARFSIKAADLATLCKDDGGRLNLLSY